MEKTKPVHEVRMGLVKAAVWRNDAENGRPHFNTTFTRIYKKEKGGWGYSDSFGRDDLLVLGQVATRVNAWIYEQQNPEQEAEAEKHPA